MSDEPKPDDAAQPDPMPEEQPPDGRGQRPSDPNELAKWIIDQTTGDCDKPQNPE